MNVAVIKEDVLILVPILSVAITVHVMLDMF